MKQAERDAVIITDRLFGFMAGVAIHSPATLRLVLEELEAEARALPARGEREAATFLEAACAYMRTEIGDKRASPPL